MKSITIAERQGDRSYQEDRHLSIQITLPNFTTWLLAVMDGHFGPKTSEFCSKKIGDLFKLTMADQPEIALKKIVAQLHAETKDFKEGTTLSLALIVEKPKQRFSSVSVAILGDSPVIIYDKSGQIHVSPEHNVRTNSTERKAAEDRGGIYHTSGYIGISGFAYSLQLGRALGDAKFGKVLSRKPEIYTIPDPQWVLVATDGLLDPSHRDNANLIGEISAYAKEMANADTLMDWAEKRGLEDNATAIVWK